MLSSMGRSPGHSDCLLQFLPASFLCSAGWLELSVCYLIPILSSTRCLGCWEETLSSFPRSPTHFNELAGSPAPHCPLASLPLLSAFKVAAGLAQLWPAALSVLSSCGLSDCLDYPTQISPTGILESHIFLNATPSHHCFHSCWLLNTHLRKNRRRASGGRRVPCPLFLSRSEQMVVRMLLGQHS